MFSSQVFWTIYPSVVALLFAIPTTTAVIKGTRGLPLIIWLNIIGAVIPVPCWIAAMGFAVCGASKRPPRRPAEPAEPARMLMASSPALLLERQRDKAPHQEVEH